MTRSASATHLQGLDTEEDEQCGSQQVIEGDLGAGGLWQQLIHLVDHLCETYTCICECVCIHAVTDSVSISNKAMQIHWAEAHTCATLGGAAVQGEKTSVKQPQVGMKSGSLPGRMR